MNRHPNRRIALPPRPKPVHSLSKENPTTRRRIFPHKSPPNSNTPQQTILKDISEQYYQLGDKHLTHHLSEKYIPAHSNLRMQASCRPSQDQLASITQAKAEPSKRKKSVTFNSEKPEQLNSHSKNKHSKLTRQRSTSILKSRLTSRDSSSSSLSKQLRTYSSASILNPRRMSQHRNDLVKERYHQLLRRLRNNNSYMAERRSRMVEYGRVRNQQQGGQGVSRYSDGSFAPSAQSIWKDSKGKPEMQWKRVSQLYGSATSILPESRKITMFSSGNNEGMGKEFAKVLRCLSVCPFFLTKIFEQTQLRQQGIYIVRLFEDGEWRHKIIDDWVPVTRHYLEFLPAFIRGEGLRQCWPLLLQKALAVRVGNYEALHELKCIEILTDLMGIPLHQIDLPSGGAVAIPQIQGEKSIICLGWHRKKGEWVSIRKCKQTALMSFEEPSENSKQSKERKIDYSLLNNCFSKLCLAHLEEHQHLTHSSINIVDLRASRTSPYFHKSNHSRSIVAKSISLDSTENVSLMLTSSSALTKHTWRRLIVLQKQYDGFRWVTGKYDCQTLSLRCRLEPGTYYLLCVPDWTLKHPQDFNLTVFSRNEIPLEEVQQPLGRSAFEKGCCDLAQSMGRLCQINKWICAYTLIYKQSGLIIENIHNERRKGKVRIFRSLRNLRPNKCQIIAFNGQFHSGDRNQGEVEISIDSGLNYSIVLMLGQGNDCEFMESFQFAS